MSKDLSLEEQEKILIIAESLIREPGSWKTGDWKCELWEQKGGELVQAKDQNGNPLYQYCIEGAVNQATYDVVGEQRALELGAIGTVEGEFYTAEGELVEEERISWNVDEFGGDIYGPTDLLGLNEIARNLFPDEVGCLDRAAMHYNDDYGTHSGVLKILHTRLQQVQEELAKKNG